MSAQFLQDCHFSLYSGLVQSTLFKDFDGTFIFFFFQLALENLSKASSDQEEDKGSERGEGEGRTYVNFKTCFATCWICSAA